MKLVITVVGKDQVGIIAKVSNILADNDVNILDISQTILQDKFTMMMYVEMNEQKINISLPSLWQFQSTVPFRGWGTELSGNHRPAFPVHAQLLYF